MNASPVESNNGESASGVKRLKCGVVGVGYLGRFHAQKYSELENCELVGVFDESDERCKEIASELNVKAFSSLEEFGANVQAATVAATTSAHYGIVKKLLNLGVHVNVEKPMTSTCEEAEEIVALAREKNLKLQVGHVERFNPALQAARGKLEKPLFIECHRLAPFKPRGVDVSVVLDLMIHDLDVIMALVKSPVKSVSAVGTPVMTDTVDIANARVEFESGAIANVTASRVSQVATRKFRVFQQNQYMSIDFGSGNIELMSKVGDWTENKIPLEKESWNLEKGDALLAETESFVKSVLEDRECEVTGEDGLAALRLAEKITEDIQSRI